MKKNCAFSDGKTRPELWRTFTEKVFLRILGVCQGEECFLIFPLLGKNINDPYNNFTFSEMTSKSAARQWNGRICSKIFVRKKRKSQRRGNGTLEFVRKYLFENEFYEQYSLEKLLFVNCSIQNYTFDLFVLKFLLI
jgi:hypothetical protein